MKSVLFRPFGIVLAAATLVASGCGSTVQGTTVGQAQGAQGGTLDGGSDDFGEGAALPGEETGASPTGAADARTTRRAGQAGGPAPTTATTAGGPAPVSNTAGGGKIPVGPGVPGVSDDVIKVGFVNVDIQAAVAVTEAAGGGAGGGALEDDPKTVGNAVTKYLNERGGIAGRKVEVVWYEADVGQYATSEGRRSEGQRACTKWTEDNEVFAILGTFLFDDVYLDCAARNNSIVVPYHDGLTVDEQRAAEVGNSYFSITSMTNERRERNLVDNLVRRGILTRDSKVGIMIEDRPVARRGVERGMEPALAKHGIPVVAKITYPDAAVSPWSNYVLQMRTAGVTHVLFAVPWVGGWPVLFMQRVAEEQRWRPVWGMGSDGRPYMLSSDGAPREQMANTYLMGWKPPADGDALGGAFDATPTRDACNEIEKQNDIRTDTGWLWCDPLFFLKAALEASPEISPAGMTAGVANLGTSYRSIATIGGATNFEGGRHHGVAVQRDVIFDPRCTSDGVNCWQYTGPPYPMP